MKQGDIQLAIGFPVDEEKRDQLRRIAPNAKLPAVYPGSIKVPCAKCHLELWVGPRVAAALSSGTRLLCPWCVARFQRDFGIDELPVTSLDNPDSKMEGE